MAIFTRSTFQLRLNLRALWLGLFILLPAKASTPLLWSQLESNTSLALARALDLDADLLLKSGTKVRIESIEGFDSIAVILVRSTFLDCPSELQNREVPLLLVDDQYGVELRKNCDLWSFLETKDINQPSFFSNE